MLIWQIRFVCFLQSHCSRFFFSSFLSNFFLLVQNCHFCYVLFVRQSCKAVVILWLWKTRIFFSFMGSVYTLSCTSSVCFYVYTSIYSVHHYIIRLWFSVPAVTPFLGTCFGVATSIFRSSWIKKEFCGLKHCIASENRRRKKWNRNCGFVQNIFTVVL